MVECAGLEIQCTFRRTVGSNPTLSAKKWGTLTDDQKKALSDASTETATFKTGYDAEQSKKQLDELTAKGMKANELSAAGLEEFKAVSKSLYPQFSTLIGKEFFDQAIAFAPSK